MEVKVIIGNKTMGAKLMFTGTKLRESIERFVQLCLTDYPDNTKYKLVICG